MGTLSHLTRDPLRTIRSSSPIHAGRESQGSRLPRLALILCFSGLLIACGSGGESGPARMEITKTRVLKPVDSALAGRVDPVMAARAGGSRGTPSAASAKIHYILPAGWVELPTTSMRVANFSLEAEPRAECYLTQLPGTAGGLAANVNRWRGQMGLPALSEEVVNELPRFEFLGGGAVSLDVEGTWSGMGGGEGEAGWRMLGLLLVDPAGSAFLKMVGPSEVIAVERERFAKLAASMHGGDGHSHGDSEDGSAPDGGNSGSLLSGGGPVSSPGDPAPPPTSISQGLSWVAPEAWDSAPDRPFRNANYFAGSEAVEAYISVLPGDAGGPLANVNRWRSQMGQGPLNIEEFDGLERLAMLDSAGVLIEIEGSYQSMSGGNLPEAMMLGVLGQVPGRSVFVKMIGPTDLVLEQRESFLEFCRSLETVTGG